MSGSQMFMLGCFVLAAAIYGFTAALPSYLRSVRRWYDTLDALETSHPELAEDWRNHVPLHIRPVRRWVGP